MTQIKWTTKEKLRGGQTEISDKLCDILWSHHRSRLKVGCEVCFFFLYIFKRKLFLRLLLPMPGNRNKYTQSSVCLFLYRYFVIFVRSFEREKKITTKTAQRSPQNNPHNNASQLGKKMSYVNGMIHRKKTWNWERYVVACDNSTTTNPDRISDFQRFF